MDKASSSTPVAELRDLTRIALFVALTGAGAFIYIPLGPLFLSLQTMMVMLTGFALGPKNGALAMLAYLACGAVGLPVFGRGMAGPGYFFGPTAGYLPGFVLGAAIAGVSGLIERRRARRWAMAVCGFAGVVVVLGLGAAGLRLTVADTWGKALAIGFYPFLLGDTLKMFAAAAVCELFFRPPPAEERG